MELPPLCVCDRCEVGLQMKGFDVASSSPLTQSFHHTCVKMSSRDKLCHGILSSTIQCQDILLWATSEWIIHARIFFFFFFFFLFDYWNKQPHLQGSLERDQNSIKGCYEAFKWMGHYRPLFKTPMEVRIMKYTWYLFVDTTTSIKNITLQQGGKIWLLGSSTPN